MSGSFTVNDDGTTTVVFEYTAATAKVAATVDAAAHMLYNSGREPTVESEDENGAVVQVVTPWDDLSNQDKLDMVDELILEKIKKLARGYQNDVDMAAQMEETEQTVEDTYI
jgi:multidrug efflux pump subunit AcrB